jgi:hypothetical protein
MIISENKSPLTFTPTFQMYLKKSLLTTYSEDIWKNSKFMYKLYILYRNVAVAFIVLLKGSNYSV